MLNTISNAFLSTRNKVRRIKRKLLAPKKSIPLLNSEGAEMAEGGALEDLVTILHCPVCLEMTIDPHIVAPCEHVFCGDCIALWQGMQLGGTASCPVCKCDIDGHSQSRLLAQVCEKVKLLQTAKSEVANTAQSSGPTSSTFYADDSSVDAERGIDSIQSKCQQDAITCCWILQGKLKL